MDGKMAMNDELEQNQPLDKIIQKKKQGRNKQVNEYSVEEKLVAFKTLKN